MLSLLPGMSLTAQADGAKYALTFSASGRTVTRYQELPTTFNSVQGDLPYGEGALDSIIGELYWSQGICSTGETPTVNGGSGAVTAGLNNNYQYITINQYFNDTVTVTGKYTLFPNSEEIDYSISITCAEYEEYPLWVGGTQVTSANKDDVLGGADEGATVTYTPAEGTSPAALTLNNANITTGYPDDPKESGIYYNGAAPLDIVLAEESVNSIKKIADEFDPNKDFRYGGIYSADTNAAVTISGTGNLTAKGSYAGIKAEKDVTIKSGDVSAEGLVVGISAANDVTIKGGTVAATATVDSGDAHGIIGGKNVTIEGGVVIASATGNDGDGIKAYDGNVVISDGNITASGKAQAIIGTVKNATAGTGWTNTEGTEGQASIAVNTTGQELTYKKVQFLPAHTHDFTYSVSEDFTTITATCGKGDCTLDDGNGNHTATLTIAPKDDGTATLTGGKDFGVTDADIKYTKNQEPTTAEAIKTAEGAAFYKASITVGKDNNTATAEVTYGVNEVKKDTSFNKTTANGDFTVPSIATIGATVSIPTTPDAGYELTNITAVKADNSSAENVGKDGNTGTFTMPSEEVTVSAEFQKRNVLVKLAVNTDAVAGAAKASCTAELLNDDADFTPAGDSFSSQVGDKFILRVNCNENYDFTITGSTQLEFIQLDKARKQDYIRTHSDVDANTQLFLVTMPGVEEGDLTVTVAFQEIKVYTILYQPSDQNASDVWCKVANETGFQNTNKSFRLKMNPDAEMGNVKTFALTVSMPAAPQKIAFGGSELADNVEMTNVSVKENAEAAGTWQETVSDKFLVISGNARTVIAAFTPNDTAFTARTDAVRNLPANTKYQIAVCGVGAAGTVKAPAPPTAPAGKEFAGWGYRSELAQDGKDTYNAGADISITDDAIFGAVWTPVTPTVTVDLKGGDINGNTDSVTISNVHYNQAISDALQNLLPKKNGFVLDGWTVNANVTEGGNFFSRGSAFDPDTPITGDLGLNAQWKHVHSYTCVPLSYFDDDLSAYFQYAPYIHVKFCGCYDVELEAHSFENGVCTGCGAEKPGTETATLNVCYWIDGQSNAWMQEVPRTDLKKNEEVTVSAFYQIGDCRFSKWQYRFNNGDDWKDLSASTMVGFLIPMSMQVRALYTEMEIRPQVSLSASKYVTNQQGSNCDTVLFQMDYKLPKDCTYVDAGIRMGDNQGISFYSLKKRKVSAFETAFNFITSDPISFTYDQITSDPNYIIEKCEDNVLNAMNMSAATLAKYIMEKKPINIPEYEPIYWQASPTTKGRSGSVNTLTPLSFIQKNNGKHFIYGVGWLRYKDKNGNIQTIYTEALPTTRDSVPSNTVTKIGSNGQN